MTPIKLAMLALALVALVAGALIVKHDATVGGTLLVVGGKLVGLTFPEIGAKKGPPSGGQSEGGGDVFPQTSDGKPLSDSTALLSWHVAPLGLRLAAGVLLACLLSCSSADRSRDIKTAIEGARAACLLYDATKAQLPNKVPEAENLCPVLMARDAIPEPAAATSAGGSP